MNKKPSKDNLVGRVLLSIITYFLLIGASIVLVYCILQKNLILNSMAASIIVLFAFLCLSVITIVYMQNSTTGLMEVLSNKTMMIKYHDSEMPKLEYVDGKSDWIDLYTLNEVTIREGDSALVDLGISVRLPKGYELLIAPRSSTFKNFGLIQTNSVGIVDESYSSDKDTLKWACYATRPITIPKYARVCQFRIIEHQPKLEFCEVETLGDNERGGFGSTGIF